MATMPFILGIGRNCERMEGNWIVLPQRACSGIKRGKNRSKKNNIKEVVWFNKTAIQNIVGFGGDI